MKNPSMQSKKAKISSIVPNSHDFSTLISLLDEKTDFEVVVLGGAYLDRMIELRIIAKLQEINEGFDRSAFNEHRVLKDFDHKIKLGFHLGFFDKEIYGHFKTIRDIRNIFAHSVMHVDFLNESIKGKSLNLNPFSFFDPQIGLSNSKGFEQHFDLPIVTFTNSLGKIISSEDYILVTDKENKVGVYVLDKSKKDLSSPRERFICSVQMAWFRMMLEVIQFDQNLVMDEIQLPI
ncbi:hypothetical protein [Serratia quinivorans]|uniref:hypothetical protein n=1 Tax=Serratia quinivorans TaxID=137545 RepID=UPI002179FC6B|nr:hypothetical protein [Serratia quinivorans]CAI1501428.1 Uncharacterised protein [Serratia quinivorans]CAI1543640.1 Uncharacterised protein [Serratia quinivorans]